MKKYCENCNYFSTFSFKCKRFKVKPKMVDTPYGIAESSFLTPPWKFNKDNSCKYYKRKWWKFWIKREEK